MKNNHRFFALFALLAVGTSFLLGSCGGETDAVTESDTVTDALTAAVMETAAEPERDRLAELGSRDLGGMVYTALDCNSAAYSNIPGEVQTGEIVNDTLWERDAVIEELYNVQINYELENSGSTSKFRSAVLAGEKPCDLIFTVGAKLSTLALEGVLANMLDIEHLSLDQKWWSSLMYDNLRLKNAMYFTTGDICPSMYRIAACTYVNTKLADDYDITCDFVQEVRDGTWTWDLVGELSKGINQDLNQDGQWAYIDDLFGNIGCFATYLMPACNVEYCTITEDGTNLALTAVTDQTVTIVEKLRTIFEPTNPKSEGNDFVSSAFKEDRALFLTGTTGNAFSLLRDMESDYTILPVAKFDKTQKGYRTAVNIWSTAYVGVPMTAMDEKSGFVTEALAAWSYTNMRPITLNLTYKDKLARDEQSLEMLDIVYDNLYLSFAEVYDFGGIPSIFYDVLAVGGELVSQVEKVASKAEKEMKDFVDTWGNVN